ncbi:oxidoreductase FAD/NAD(P)-binding subunit [Ignicoccus hospitalis]|uniref:Oxidoreductase FAD/NAD(P)-binding domain protein n=1 Tax=Ignicoccus hospitalis (strain KIN4/I / DSM 18386 / JCM 14125) TaxID=453591 RepID=A8A8H4_IGNH4|nr:oxidoreductase FAD/NAD(P)-binding subunit [Ignicoccus hospitalis]ABU81226.1 oxidoreductase FAD/NAD(P)-binding domain protein [Ignicoccus hospitalis KIN4/I]HIH90656.1 dihydroorotate dehydrogenase [Desulfurococcaceae archaeon]
MSFKVEEVLRSRKLAKGIYETFVSYHGEAPPPGTFFMVWVPGHEAIPLSVAGYRGDAVRFIVEVRGRTTAALYTAHKVGLLGPLGRQAPVPSGKPLLVGGGVGIAPLLYMKELWGGELLFGAKSAEKVPKIDGIDEVATEDGSLGFKGTVVDLLKLRPQKRDVYACGPPSMISSLKVLAKEMGLKGYYSTEKMIKCGIGICGSCVLEGKLLCKEPWLRLG